MGTLLLAAGARAQALPSSARLIDGFDSTAGWSAHPSDGVSLAITADTGGAHGHALRLDFDFHGHGGYAIARKAFDIALPENYAFSFRIRGRAPNENLEFKLIDSTGDNVWWNNAVNTVFPSDWREVTLEKRHITFAWGPRGGGELAHLATIEISITAGTGGTGTGWLDDLTFTPLDPVRPYTGTPVASSTSSSPDHRASLGADGKAATFWKSAMTSDAQTFTLDFGSAREFGGATIDWAPGLAARKYVVETSADGTKWDSVYAVDGGNGGRDWIYLPETDSREIRVRIPSDGAPRAYAIRELVVIPVEWSATRNDFLAHVAASAPPGSYPTYLSAKQSYWTVIGVGGDDAEALINEQGAIEPHAGGFSIEPFLRSGGRFVTWHDARQSQSLAQGYLPIPSVTWRAGTLTLEITAFAAGSPDSSTLYARYRITNTGRAAASPTLYLAVRPFQVNPSWQFLATQGGAAPIAHVAWEDSLLRVNDSLTIVPLTAPSAAGASTFDAGNIVDALRTGTIPTAREVRDATESASAAMAYPLAIPAGSSRDVWLSIPFHAHGALSHPFVDDADARAFAERRLADVTRSWEESLNRVAVQLPPSASRIANTLRAQLAYILVNDHGARIDPGARSYARSWIRDGSMIGAALLRLGHPEEVRAFLEWYAPYQFPNGKVPCCVDARGADPVPENDSHGEWIHLVDAYYGYTHDKAWLATMWPGVSRTEGYMESLRVQSRLDAPQPMFAGLMPPSISHEGYSDKPAWSYWDDFWALTGYRGAARIAQALGRAREARAFTRHGDD
ncbi:MAG: discoidin domain-containing protein, partial [Gemmatimonadaceae bacterium]